MWPILAEFRSASNLRDWAAKKRKKESVVKYMSADNYVRRPIIIRKVVLLG